jgi:hypothetical protein
LNTADTIIVTSKTTKAEFQAITNKPIAVITNGYDTEEVAKQLDSKFTLAHIGFFFERNPLILWESLAELSAEIQILNPFRNKINGAVSQEVLQLLKLGYIPI